MVTRISSLQAGLIALAVSLSGCVIDPNAYPSYPPPSGGGGPVERPVAPEPKRAFVKTIKYAKGDISYFRTSNSREVDPSKVRICLENNTGQPKMMMWTQIQSGVNHMNTPRNGDRSCVTLRLDQRVEWNFLDRLMPVKSDGMNLTGFGGMLVEFIWVRDY